ncbi:MAG TPA: TniB family NTP-binding protein [Pyrinomonadaceae bacterium]|jgi:predicted AAA+ superfamily ATPase|nr:TniB family NTP-binding protein [Pyrinomonadaceae bacterium]
MKKRKEYLQVSVQERKKMIEQLYVIYPRIQMILDKFAYCHLHAKVAGEPEGMLLEGPAGMGKTTLCKYYIRDFPVRVTEERTIMPILLAKVEVPASPKSLVTSLLTALGDPLSDRGTTVSQTLRLKRLMYECGVELMFLDEFQHFIDKDSKKVLQTISDWLKNLMDSTGKPIILVGMPYSHNILDAEGNEQLQRRFSMRVSLKPFNWRDVEDRDDFRRFLQAVDEKLPFNEWSNLSDTNIAFLLYIASDGIVSKVMRLIRRAASIALDLSRERLDLDLFNVAYKECLAAADPDKENPFNEGVKDSSSKPAGKYKPKRATNARSKAKGKQLRASDVL